jgi:hypothetical protein
MVCVEIDPGFCARTLHANSANADVTIDKGRDILPPEFQSVGTGLFNVGILTKKRRLFSSFFIASF